MCLGVPGRIVEIFEEHGLRMGKVDFGGVSRAVCLEHVAEAGIGEYVIVHVGFALAAIDEQEARRIFAMLEEIDGLDELRVEDAS